MGMTLTQRCLHRQVRTTTPAYAMMIANAVAHYCPGSGSEVRSEAVRAASGNHNEWSNDEWDKYESWTKKFKSKMLASQRRR